MTVTAAPTDFDTTGQLATTAAGSSFYRAMRVLPRDRREAMFAIYGFCRAVDDVADSDRPATARLTELEDYRRELGGLYSGESAPRLAMLAPVIAEFGLRQEDFSAVIDGMTMDAVEPPAGHDWASLDRYCDCVASAVGRLSAPVFGLAEEPGRDLSHHLGRALQLTNILRDLDEDAGMGRLYLPAEALEAAGIAAREPAAVLADERLDAACREVAARARLHFVEAGRIMDGVPRRSARAPRLMMAAYGSILDRLEARGWAPPRAPVSASRGRLVLALLRHGLF